MHGWRRSRRDEPVPDVSSRVARVWHAGSMRRIGMNELARRAREVLVRFRHPNRRFNCQDQTKRSWELRAEEAVRLLGKSFDRIRTSDRRVQIGDFACGNERLRPLLEREFGAVCDYQGYDLHPQSPSVERLDLSRGVPARHFDAVFCLGILEYLPDVPAFAVRLRSVCRLAIVSYAVADGSETLLPPERRARQWVNHFTRSEVEEIFVRAGFVKVAFVLTNLGRTGLWLFSTEAERGASVE